MKPDSMDALFRALAHPVRRRILDFVKSEPGCNIGQVAELFEISRIAVMKHIAILEEADLLVSERQGRERHLYFNVVPIQIIYDRWTTEYSAIWAGRLTGLKYRVETNREEES